LQRIGNLTLLVELFVYKVSRCTDWYVQWSNEMQQSVT
jgi:hypothetical protein